MNEFELVNKQLAHSNLNLPDGMNLIPSYVDETTFTELNRIKEAIGKEIEQLEKERVSIRHEITLIEEGGTYTELLHQFHQEKYELEEMARTWAVFQTAKYVLQKGMEKYKVERLPKVLLQASKYFLLSPTGLISRFFLIKKVTNCLSNERMVCFLLLMRSVRQQENNCISVYALPWLFLVISKTRTRSLLMMVLFILMKTGETK